MDWYRAYVGACAGEEIAEAAAIAGEGKALIIAIWDLLLESACHDKAAGGYSTTPPRMAATLGEPIARVETAIAALTDVGMISAGAIVAWAKHQPRSTTPAPERQRRSRGSRRAESVDAEPFTP